MGHQQLQMYTPVAIIWQGVRGTPVQCKIYFEIQLFICFFFSFFEAQGHRLMGGVYQDLNSKIWPPKKSEI